MTPQEATEALARMKQWHGMSNDEAHELLGEALEFIASMEIKYEVRYVMSGDEEFGTGRAFPTRSEANVELAVVLEDDPQVARIVRRQVSPLETMTTAVSGGTP